MLVVRWEKSSMWLVCHHRAELWWSNNVNSALLVSSVLVAKSKFRENASLLLSGRDKQSQPNDWKKANGMLILENDLQCRFLMTPATFLFVSWQSMGWTNRLLKPSSPDSFQAMSSNRCLGPPVYCCCQEYSLDHTGARSVPHLHQQLAMRKGIFEKLVDNKKRDARVDMPSSRASV